MAEWIRHCQRTGLYVQGKLLYERAGLRLARLGKGQVVAKEGFRSACAYCARAAREEARSGGAANPAPGRCGCFSDIGLFSGMLKVAIWVKRLS